MAIRHDRPTLRLRDNAAREAAKRYDPHQPVLTQRPLADRIISARQSVQALAARYSKKPNDKTFRRLMKAQKHLKTLKEMAR